MADPKSLEQVGNFDEDDDDDLTEYARSRALNGEPMSPTASQATKGWEGMTSAQRTLRLNMLESVDPAAAKEARGFMQAGFFGDAPVGQGHGAPAAPNIDEMAPTQQATDPKRAQQGSGNKPQEPGFSGVLLNKAKEALSKADLKGAVAGAALGMIPGAMPAAAGLAAREYLRRGAFEDNAKDTAADAKTRMAGTMEAPPGAGAPTLEADQSLPPPPGGGGPQVIEAGIGTLHGSSRQTQQVQEDQQARQMRERATLMELGAAAGQSEADRKMSNDMLVLSDDRIAINNRFEQLDKERAANEAKVRADNERRIREAEKAFEEAEPDPKWNPYQEVANGSWDKGILLGLGSMLGAVGAAMTHGPDRFLEQFNAQIARRVEAARELRKHRGQVAQDRRDGYTRALEALGSQRALDAALEARAWRGLDARIEQIAAQHNWDSQNPQLQAVRAGIMMKYREANMQAAKHVTEASQSQQAFRPMTVVAGGGGGEDPMEKGLEKLMEAREKKQLPQIEGALDTMNTAIQRMKLDPSIRNQIAAWVSSGNTGDALRLLGPFIASDPQALQAFTHAMVAYRQAKSGKALTASESAAIQREVGTADPVALAQFYLNIEADRNALEADLYSAFKPYYGEFYRRRNEGRHTPGPQSSYKPVSAPVAGGAPVSR